MSNKQEMLKKLLHDNPQIAVVVAELLGPPLGLREPGGQREPSEGA